MISIKKHNPDVFAIHEANYSIKNDTKIKGYKIECINLIHGNDNCRTITLIRDGISYKRRFDLENKYISAIWLQIFIKKRVSILVCSFYRQWGLPASLNINESNSIQSQCNRYNIFFLIKLKWLLARTGKLLY